MPDDNRIAPSDDDVDHQQDANSEDDEELGEEESESDERNSTLPSQRRRNSSTPTEPVRPERYFPRKCVLPFRFVGMSIIIWALVLVGIQVRTLVVYSGKATGAVMDDSKRGDGCMTRVEFDVCNDDNADDCKAYQFEDDCDGLGRCSTKGYSPGLCMVRSNRSTYSMYGRALKKGHAADVVYDPDDPSKARIAKNVYKTWIRRIVPTGVSGMLVVLVVLPCTLSGVAAFLAKYARRREQIYAEEQAKEARRRENSSCKTSTSGLVKHYGEKSNALDDDGIDCFE